MNKLKILWLILACCCLNSIRSIAQCPPVADPCTDTIHIDAPDTLVGCIGDFSFNTVISWNGLTNRSYWWSPSVSYTEDVTATQTTLTNDVSVSSTSTYCLTAKARGPELVLNGSFTNTTPLCFTQEAPYFLTTDVLMGNRCQILPSITHLGATLTARSGPNMLVVNGGRGAGTEAFWRQTIPVCPGAIYNFSAYYANYNAPVNPADFTQIIVRINGVAYGPYSTTTNTVWTLISFTWTAGATTTTADIRLEDANTVEWLNDFGVDDISFVREDRETKCVTLVPVPTTTFTISGPSCVCSGNSFTLSSSITSGAGSGISYNWDYGAASTPNYDHPGITVPCEQARVMNIPLTVINGPGCKKTVYHDITVYPRPEIYSISGPTGPICGSDKIKLTAKRCGKGIWSVISGGAGIATIMASGADNEFNFRAANVCCPTTIHLRYKVSSPCPDCPSDSMDYYLPVKPKPHAGITILSCNPLCPGNDVELQVCGSPGATVHYSYAYPGCAPIDQTLVLPAGPCCLSICTTIVVPRAPCPMAEGDFVSTLQWVELDSCQEDYYTDNTIRIAYPSATIELIGPPPCQGDPYCIRITGTPGARVNLFPEYMPYDPSYPAYVDLPTSTTGSNTSITICGLVIPPPAPGGTSYGMNTFCIQSIVAPAACGGCMVESAESYIDELHHPLPCLNVTSRQLPQFGLSYDGPVCKPNPFTMTVNIYALGGTPASISWIHIPLFPLPLSTGSDGSPVIGANTETVNPGLPGNYIVLVTGTNGCFIAKTLHVIPGSSVAPPTVSVTGSVCEGTLGVVGVTFTGVPGTVINYLITPYGATPSLTLDGTGTVTVPMTVGPLTTIEITGVYHPGYCKGKGPFGKVTVPMNPAPKANIACSGGLCGGSGTGSSVSLTFTGTFGANVTYTSSPLATGMPATATVPSTVTITPAPTVSTTYSITDVVDPATGCHNITSPAPCTTGIADAPTCPPSYTYNATTHVITFTSPVGGIINCTFVDILGTILNPVPIPVSVGTMYTIPATTNYIFINPIEVNGCTFYYDCVVFPVESSGGGGSSTGEIERGVNPGKGTHNIDEIIKDASNLVIVPNPNTGTFTLSGYLLQLADAKDVTIEISDMLGKTVYTDQLPVTNGKVSKQVTMTDVANGTYIIKIKHQGTVKTIRFVLDR